MKRLVVLFLLSAFLFSCEDVVKIDLKEGSTLMVIDAFITNDNSLPQKVRLTTTSPYFSNGNTPAVVSANVELRDLTNGKVYNFISAGNGDYIFSPSVSDTLGVVNHSYELKVQHSGNTWLAYSVLKRTTRIDTILFEDTPPGGLANNDPNVPKKYYPYLIARDTAGAKDFYWIKSYKNGRFFNDRRVVNVCEDAGGGSGTDGLYFIPPVAFFNITPPDTSFKTGDIATIEVLSLNRDAYDFLVQLTTQMNNASAGLFAVTPENVRTNILNATGNSMKAIGFFNMGATVRKSVPAPL